MQKFWDAVEAIWNDSRVLAWVLALTGIGAVLWASFWPQSPGVSIGLLALAAGIMSVRPKMHPVEKFAWVGVLVSFAVLEVLAIGRSDRANDSARDLQNRQFAEIAKGLEGSIASSKQQYDSTITHVDGVLKTTQNVGTLAKRNLEAITGGKSFAFVLPTSQFYSFYTQNMHFSVNIKSIGNDPLSGVLALHIRCANVRRSR